MGKIKRFRGRKVLGVGAGHVAPRGMGIISELMDGSTAAPPDAELFGIEKVSRIDLLAEEVSPNRKTALCRLPSAYYQASPAKELLKSKMTPEEYEDAYREALTCLREIRAVDEPFVATSGECRSRKRLAWHIVNTADSIGNRAQRI